MPIDPITGAVIASTVGNIAGGILGSEEKRKDRELRERQFGLDEDMQKRAMNMQEKESNYLDASRSSQQPFTAHMLQQLLQRLGAPMGQQAEGQPGGLPALPAWTGPRDAGPPAGAMHPQAAPPGGDPRQRLMQMLMGGQR